MVEFYSLSADLDNMLDWEDSSLMEWEDLPRLSWTEIKRIENNREKARRIRRVKVQRRALLLMISIKNQERMEISEWPARILLEVIFSHQRLAGT